MPIGAEDLRSALRDALSRQGWLTWLDDDDADEEVGDYYDRLMLICGSFDVGTVVRRRGDSVWPHPQAA